MSVLILHRNPFRPFPYQEWLTGRTGDVVVLAARDKLGLPGEEVPDGGDLGFTRLEVFDDFDAEAVDTRALELAEEFRVTHVVAHHEADVDRAARLRERLGLDGAWTEDVRPFRDKLLMKRLARQAGIEVAPHVLAHTADEAREFAGRYGLPLVCKERAGYNSVGLRILRDEDELESCLADVFPGPPRDDVLLEAFVPGRMCHVDGLVVDGRTVAAWPSQYQYDLSSFAADPGPRVDLTLDPDDPLTPRLLDLVDRVLTALRPEGTRLRDHAFHAEVFHTPDGRLVLCEIACRSGGAKIREVFRTMFGIHLAQYVTRAEAGMPLPGFEDGVGDGPPPRPRCMSGQVLTMKRPGLVRALPEIPDDPWVEGFWLFAEPGQVIAPASGSADFLTAAVASAPTRAECERRLRGLGARVQAGTEIVPVGAEDEGGPADAGADGPRAGAADEARTATEIAVTS
ncbi:ATP-grasp domain-containing protein [Streptomyces sp. AM 4-1-1]|uniref:ATP-binding protein n=1 Tax=Streptomyces sp. AM 4-1-1 TaxID=3028710 RepID=UPI0023B9B4B1|nr:ATP-grasp domain-containing protein [Streptomyces sp. AM 4-1-1]WEH34920.1 ATP-grasp domain-containing protein [Streptomyces sp. AM 4-1-1]